MRVLSWNLFHGRSQPPAGRELQAEFAAALAGWSWDVALLQEVPPWWGPALAQACGAHVRAALTSRNALLALRRPLARRWPDVIKSKGGGANAILVRGLAIGDQRSVVLRRWPERRVCHAVALEGGLWCANLHAQAHSPQRAAADIARAAAATLAWSQDGPAVLGGDFNVRRPQAQGFEWIGGHGVDHVLAHALRGGGETELPERGGLSDHAPIIVTVLTHEQPQAG